MYLAAFCFVLRLQFLLGLSTDEEKQRSLLVRPSKKRALNMHTRAKQEWDIVYFFFVHSLSSVQCLIVCWYGLYPCSGDELTCIHTCSNYVVHKCGHDPQTLHACGHDTRTLHTCGDDTRTLHVCGHDTRTLHVCGHDTRTLHLCGHDTQTLHACVVMIHGLCTHVWSW